MKNELNMIDKIIRAVPIVLSLIVLAAGCGIEPTVREGSEGAYVRLPFVKVLLDESRDVITVDGEDDYSIEGVVKGANVVYKTGSKVRIKNEYGRLHVWLEGQLIPESYGELFVIPNPRRSILKLNGKPYRGMFQIIPNRSNIRVINNVHVDDYLKGVVPTEIGNVGEEELEAVKAQAVAARTYAISHVGQYDGEPYDLKSDVSDQVYGGIETERKLISKGVDATRGYVIMYHDRPINAYYHSTCGGLTDEIDKVWDKAETPYLKSVYDEAYCQWSKYFTWEEVYTVDQLQLRIEQYLSSDRGKIIRIGDITDIAVTSRTPGGRVADLTVTTDRGTYHFGKDRIRWVFRRSTNPNLILQSARFNVVLRRDDRGKIETAAFRGGGYGHGVGMCQCGAIGRSRAGQSFEQILRTYYSGVELKKLY